MEASLENARLLFQQGRHQDSILLCEKILSRNSDSLDALKLISRSYLAIRETAKQAYFNKALSFDPCDCDFIIYIGDAYQVDGDLNTARMYFRKAIKVDNSCASALIE